MVLSLRVACVYVALALPTSAQVAQRAQSSVVRRILAKGDVPMGGAPDVSKESVARRVGKNVFVSYTGEITNHRVSDTSIRGVVAELHSLKPPMVAASPKKKAPSPCGLIEDNYDYHGADLRYVDEVLTAEACCSVCSGDLECNSWTWGKERGQPHSDRCHLKSTQQPGRRASVGFTSGLPGTPAACSTLSDVNCTERSDCGLTGSACAATNAPAKGGFCGDPDPYTTGDVDYICPAGYVARNKDVTIGPCTTVTECNTNCCEACASGHSYFYHDNRYCPDGFSPQSTSPAGCCEAVCTVPTIAAGVFGWSGSNCASGASTIVAGTDCQIIAATGYTCTSPGVCGPDGNFTATGGCQAKAISPGVLTPSPTPSPNAACCLAGVISRCFVFMMIVHIYSAVRA